MNILQELFMNPLGYDNKNLYYLFKKYIKIIFFNGPQSSEHQCTPETSEFWNFGIVDLNTKKKWLMRDTEN